MMEIDDEEVLRNVAAGGALDHTLWPSLLPRIVSRIDKIAHDEFPIPQLPPPVPIVPSSLPQAAGAPSDSDETENFLPPLPSSPADPPSTTSSQETNKENSPVVLRPNAAPTSAPVAPPRVPLPPGTLPPQITAMVTEITSCLTNTFPKYPPHTIQRLSELVLTPKHHYKTLAAYLHALDRVVHVTSGMDVYPLPPAVPDMSTVSLLSNGTSEAGTAVPSPWVAPGSDEALGGALLTPIPWLQPGAQPQSLESQPQTDSTGPLSVAGPDRQNSGGASESEGELRTESTETIEGPNGMGSIETVTVINVNGVPSMGARGVGVTQGELLRQEQRAGVVPVSQLPSHHALHMSQHLRSQASVVTAQPSSSLSPSNGKSEADRRDDDGEGPEDAEGGELVSSVTGAEDEKPHARGPEEIGAADMGPQRESTTSPNYTGGPGVEMQGIDVEAAVGRKALDPMDGDENKENENEDKMEGVETTTATPATVEGSKSPEKIGQARSRSSTPKREAEDDAGGVAKKLKEDSEAETKADAEAGKQEKDKDQSDDKVAAEAVDRTSSD